MIIFLLVLFAPMSKNLLANIQRGKNVALAYPVTRAVAKAVKERVYQDEDVEVLLMARRRVEPGVIIHLASKNNLPQSYATELKQIVRREMNDTDLPVYVIAVRSILIDHDNR